jgi:hypothetical protein
VVQQQPEGASEQGLVIGWLVTVFSFQGRRFVDVKDYPSMEAAEAAIAGPGRPPAERWWRRWWRRWRPGWRG